MQALKHGLLAATLIMLVVVGTATPAGAIEACTVTSTCNAKAYITRMVESEVVEEVVQDVDYEAFLNDAIQLGGGARNVCAPGMIVCAMAGADSHTEDIGSSPDMGVMMTMGGGQSGSLWGGDAIVMTSLGNGRCNFNAWEGCILNWSDIRHSCVSTRADTTSTSGFFNTQAQAGYTDFVCEKI
jgi:hypothetical protein